MNGLRSKPRSLGNHLILLLTQYLKALQEIKPMTGPQFVRSLKRLARKNGWLLVLRLGPTSHLVAHLTKEAKKFTTTIPMNASHPLRKGTYHRILRQLDLKSL